MDTLHLKEHSPLLCIGQAVEFARFIYSQNTARDKRFSINRDKCGAKHYRLRSPNELGDLHKSGTKVRNKNETAKLFSNFLTSSIIFHSLTL